MALNRTLCVAPMMDWTDRHDRYLLRLISRHTLLYTEMVTTGALLHGDRGRHLDFDAAEHPIALQIGGSDPAEMAAAARFGAEHGYDEININVGCPSDRVQSGRFGACLMAEPRTVADCWSAMSEVVDIPVTVKTRTGIDEHDTWDELAGFVDTVACAGCRHFIIHARKAWLSGLSPKENREIPPLDYARVYRLKQERPELEIVINGGIRNLDEVATHLESVDGAMLGREAYHNPWVLADVDRRFFGSGNPTASREAVIEAYLPYVQQQLDQGVPLGHLSRHMLGLFQGRPGARAWRRYISEHAHLPGAGIEVIQRAAGAVAVAPVGNAQ